MTLLLLQIKGVSCERDGRPLFTDLDFELSEGQLVELEGPNGSGKTTLLRSLAGLTSDYEGAIERRAPFLYQGHRLGLNALLTPLENLRWYAMLQGLAVDEDALAESLERVGLGRYDETPCQFLSAGQQRRVLLARLRLCVDRDGPPLWLLDEPLTALDAAGGELVRQVLAEHAGAGGAALCATHQRLDVAGSTRLSLGRAGAPA